MKLVENEQRKSRRKINTINAFKKNQKKKSKTGKGKKSFELQGFFKLRRIWEKIINSSMNKDLEIQSIFSG